MEVADDVGTANLEEIITTWVMAGMASVCTRMVQR